MTDQVFESHHRADIHILTSCQQQDLTPNFLRFKLFNRHLHHTRLYRSCQRQFLGKELRTKQRALKLVSDKLSSAKYELKQAVSWLDYNHLTCLIDRLNAETIARVNFTQKKKLKVMSPLKI